MRHYLIDFENTHTRGLKLEQVSPGDCVHIFYSRAAAKLDMSALPSGIQVNIDFFEVQTGKQALDMQLASYLGYLVKSANGDRSIGITIVSCDTDYDTVVSFWKKLVPGLALERMGLEQTPAKKANAKSAKKSTAKKKTAEKELPEPAEEEDPGYPLELLTEEEPEPDDTEELPFVDPEPEAPEIPAAPAVPASPAPFMTVKEVYVPEVISPIDEEEETMAHVLNALQKEEDELPEINETEKESSNKQGRKQAEKKAPAKQTEKKTAAKASDKKASDKKASDKKASAKPAQEKKSTADKKDTSDKKSEAKVSQKTDARTELNNQIIQVLAKNKVEANTAGSVAKLILSNLNEKSGKQVIYREIIKTWKQEKGLQIYNLVKDLL